MVGTHLVFLKKLSENTVPVFFPCGKCNDYPSLHNPDSFSLQLHCLVLVILYIVLRNC